VPDPNGHHHDAEQRHTPEQIVRQLREADKLLAKGNDVTEAARHLEPVWAG